MLTWDHTPEAEQVFEGWVSWVMSVMKSQHFHTKSSQAKSSLELETLPDDVKKSIEQCLPIYEKMYALRMKPEI
jgi:hypothetical protein